MGCILLLHTWLMIALAISTAAHAIGLHHQTYTNAREDGENIMNYPRAGAACEAIEAMNQGFYNATDGRWGTSDAWWLSANALQAVLDYMRVTGSREYLPQAEHTVKMQRGPLPWWPEGGGDFRADSTDDTGWWALALISLFDLTGTIAYLDIARLDEAYMFSYWSSNPCGGGIIQDIPNLTYKNAISNELYMKLAASLYNRIPGETQYLQRAVQSWRWFQDSGMINPEHLINDGLTQNLSGDACSNNGQNTWTYNQGVILGGLVELYHATMDDEYLTSARTIADEVLTSETLSPGGVLKEPCDASTGCTGDQAAFKGIFVRNLADLNSVLGDRTYREYIRRNARSAWLQARNGSNFFTDSWTGPFDKATIGSQASAASLLISTL
ncbi:hypothetical protein NQ176_g771 [Zarea fungicola]|uniref:Uncharacterized protein n=1 Tax=Zarea fungicola TaxID=93591 RepID=A0ACC1NYE6_9HYPO|nr:hypothetical protein NQ176_g771 [Lecanicillium fungicola]